LSEAEKQFGYPFVLKPTVSWTGQSNRSVPVEVVNAAEAKEAATGFLSAGGEVIAQQMATGRKEGVSLFIVDRSEEHTSELKSLAYLVCRLLLEKKKKSRDDIMICNYNSSERKCELWVPILTIILTNFQIGREL